MKKASHVQEPEKFACQNEAVVSSLRVEDSTLAAGLGKFLCTYVTLPQLARVPLRKPRELFRTSFLVPPISAAQIFPSPGQREGPLYLLAIIGVASSAPADGDKRFILLLFDFKLIPAI